MRFVELNVLNAECELVSTMINVESILTITEVDLNESDILLLNGAKLNVNHSTDEIMMKIRG